MNELDLLIHQRSEKVKMMKADGDKSHETLAKLYGNPTHFITELLQNAEDEGAISVEFKLTDNELIFSHDAKKLFDFADIRAISNFGDNLEKKEKPNAIGRFGIGFKSVYSVTDKPRIVSGIYDITIVDFNVPQYTDNSISTFYNGTKIILPFKNNIEIKTFQLLKSELQDLKLEYLLFLSNIKQIKWEVENKMGFYKRDNNKNNKGFITLTSDIKERNYFQVEKNIEIDRKKLLIKIAFQLDKSKNIIPCNSSPIFVFFPTKIESNLKFLVHAPFYTTPARENIQEQDILLNIEKDDRNEKLKKELGSLLADSLTLFKRLKLLNVELLQVLPIDKEICNRSTIYKELYNSIKNEFLLNKELIPNSTGGFSRADDSMLLGSSDLSDLLSKKQANKVFGRNNWINKNITNDKTKKLRDYIRYDLDIPEYDLTNFATKIDADYLLEQSDNWLINFYKIVYKSPGLWRSNTKPLGILRSKPIIRIETNNEIKQVLPFQNDGKPAVFIPTKDQTKYVTVKENIARNKEAKKFLEELGLTTPDLFAEINKFITPKLKKGDFYTDYYNDFKKILEAFQLTSQEKRNQLIYDLKICPFLLGKCFTTGELKLLKYDQIYIQTEFLKTFYEGNSDIYFVAEENYSFSTQNQKLYRLLLKEFSVSAHPIRKPIYNKTLTKEFKILLRSKSDLPNQTSDLVRDYDLDGMYFFLQNISQERSLAMWNLLSSVQNDYFLGKYEWTNYSSNTRIKTFKAKFVNELNNNSWLYDKSKNLVSPKDINYSQLDDMYQSSILNTVFDFKPDEISEIEKRTGGKFIPREEFAAFEKFKISEENKKNKILSLDETDFDVFIPKFKPDEAIISSNIFESFPISIGFKYDQLNTEPIINAISDLDLLDIDKGLENKKEKPSQNVLNGIGRWGEECVNLDLLKEYKNEPKIEIIDLNKKGNTGIGCDFIVKQNEEIIRLIEVKSTVENKGHTLTLSGTQWEIARNFFNQTKGDVYWVYCVFNAGEKNPEIIKIQNPIQKWKDGKLIAEAVNFILKDY